ncbi:ring-1,2-phenylacetyl-CoA epoxidase subunit PaaB [Arthrobacter sp. B3I9]|uniref:1,2-phenylacetyl-CoA epoxidase subunit PaaB n=1 Tax=Arthrobacter sp. B3I9 TaxID=3042270 RepID=UPI00278D8C3E|nr:1,2-phenylacetyl-CoA epoxidase subunit PaaB [Arthrobacter sp. B3I9]MDQ0849076.1 ring-1,2-phenylacetyl-CoA epoxidase subunit PaaB [Arthrobacter sp. B3I9]
MSPHGNPEVPASSASEINRGAESVPAGSPASQARPGTPAGVGPAAGSPASQHTGSPAPQQNEETAGRNAWGLWEVFVRSSRGLSHVHAGSLHAPDAAMALRNARDLYTRRNEGVSIWVVPADAIAASDPDAKGSFFESPQGKDYRHATYYTKSEGVKHL